MGLPDPCYISDLFLVQFSNLHLVFIGYGRIHCLLGSLGEDHNPAAISESLALNANGTSRLTCHFAQFTNGAAWVEQKMDIQSKICKMEGFFLEQTRRYL